MKRARILAPTHENLRLVAGHLQQGEVAGMPTETVYGLAGNAFDPKSLARIFSVKERPTFDPLIVHVRHSIEQPSWLTYLSDLRLIDLPRMTLAAQKRTELLLRSFWPGPFTIVLPKMSIVPDLATSGLDTVAIRMPRHPIAQSLLEFAGVPLAAPSANRFGRISPTQAQHVVDELGERIDYVVDGGSCEIGLESTVVSVTETGIVSLLRPGGVTKMEIEQLLGITLENPLKPTVGVNGIASPGMLESHYAPNKSLKLLQKPVLAMTISELNDAFDLKDGSSQNIGILLMQGNPEFAAQQLTQTTGRQFIVSTLSHHGSLDEAAQNLFSGLRTLDASAADILFCEPSPSETGLGHAISDRLKRAAAKR